MRFSDNPLKNNPAGNESIPATDPSTMDDVSFTPMVITQFVATHMSLAAGSTNGLIDPTSYAKLLALDTQAQTNVRVAELAQVTIPIFFATPANTGNVVIYQHVSTVPWVLASGTFLTSAGSTNVTFSKNGAAITGLTSIGAVTAPATYAASGSPTFNTGDVLDIAFAGTTGNCANLAITILANGTISA